MSKHRVVALLVGAGLMAAAAPGRAQGAGPYQFHSLTLVPDRGHSPRRYHGWYVRRDPDIRHREGLPGAGQLRRAGRREGRDSQRDGGQSHEPGPLHGLSLGDHDPGRVDHQLPPGDDGPREWRHRSARHHRGGLQHVYSRDLRPRRDAVRGGHRAGPSGARRHRVLPEAKEAHTRPPHLEWCGRLWTTAVGWQEAPSQRELARTLDSPPCSPWPGLRRSPRGARSLQRAGARRAGGLRLRRGRRPRHRRPGSRRYHLRNPVRPRPPG